MQKNRQRMKENAVSREAAAAEFHYHSGDCKTCCTK